MSRYIFNPEIKEGGHIILVEKSRYSTRGKVESCTSNTLLLTNLQISYKTRLGPDDFEEEQLVMYAAKDNPELYKAIPIIIEVSSRVLHPFIEEGCLLLLFNGWELVSNITDEGIATITHTLPCFYKNEIFPNNQKVSVVTNLGAIFRNISMWSEEPNE